MRDPEHERRVAARGRASALPDVHVSASHEVLERLPRVRAHVDHRDRRLPVAAAARAISSGSARAPREAGLPEPEIMRSSGGLMPARGGRAPCRLDRALRPGRRARSAPRTLGRARRREHVLSFDMGGTSCDVAVIDGGRVRQAARADDRRPGAPAADGRRAHRRRRRRQHRLGRRRRRAAGRAAVGGRRCRARPATGAAARSRPSPTPTCCSATWQPGRRSPAACALDRDAAERAVASSAGALGLDVEETAWGIVRVADQEMAARAAGRDRRARSRPAPLRAGRVRRRRADARAAARRGARRSSASSARARPASCRRSAWSPPSARRDLARSVLLARGRARDGRGRASRGGAGGRRRSRELPRRAHRGRPTTCATAGRRSS